MSEQQKLLVAQVAKLSKVLKAAKELKPKEEGTEEATGETEGEE